ncbi:MAG: DUF167 family protein [Sulfurovaceae bacterium]|nr:DUF167 family protein [Sulfurovaceae bacterium]MDD5549228.1 DUF167 family protein [Sulfurovaceae bacterium]
MQPLPLKNEFFEWQNEVLILNVLGTPSAKQDKILKPKGTQLKISIKKAPEDGKATDYMVKFLANEFGVSKSNIEVVYGETSINKQFRIKSPKKIPECISF